MMIKSVTVTNHRNERRTIILADPWPSGFAITNIEGLGPVEASINTTEIPSMDGSIFNSARVSSRNIVISFVLGYFPTIEHARLELYRYFPVKKKITLEIETDIRTYSIEGYVESNVPSIFNSQESATVSIICPSPYFRAGGDDTERTGSIGSGQSFEFPFSNESLVNPLIEFGSAARSINFDVYYDGRVETGLEFHFRVLNVSSWNHVIIINKVGTTDSMVLSMDNLLSGGFQNNDELIICTIPGKKKATLIRNGISYNAINALQGDSKWLTVEPGSNIFNINIPMTELARFDIGFVYYPLYEGI